MLLVAKQKILALACLLKLLSGTLVEETLLEQKNITNCKCAAPGLFGGCLTQWLKPIKNVKQSKVFL